jgi:hypothetical protein
MSSTLPAGEHESEAKIPSTPNVKLADFLEEVSVTDGSPLGLDSNPPKEGYGPSYAQAFCNESRHAYYLRC